MTAKVQHFAHSVLALTFAGRASGHLKYEWWGAGVRCRWSAYGPADATATPSSLASLKSRMALPFWCRLTEVVLEKRPLNRSHSDKPGYQLRRTSPTVTSVMPNLQSVSQYVTMAFIHYLRRFTVEVMFLVRSVCLSVCLFVCLSVCLSVRRITRKLVNGFWRNFLEG